MQWQLYQIFLCMAIFGVPTAVFILLTLVDSWLEEVEDE